MFVLLAVLVCSTVLTSSSSAPPTSYKLEGWVLNSRNEGVKDVVVRVIYENKERVNSPATNENGHFAVDFKDLGNSIDVYYDAKDATVESFRLVGISGRRPHTFSKVLVDKATARTFSEADQVFTTAASVSHVGWLEPATAHGIQTEQTLMLNYLRIDTKAQPVSMQQWQYLQFKQRQTRQLYGLNPQPLWNASHDPIPIDPPEGYSKTNATKLIDQLRKMQGVSIDPKVSSEALAEILVKDSQQPKSRPNEFREPDVNRNANSQIKNDNRSFPGNLNKPFPTPKP